MGITPSKTPAELLKENKSAIRTSIREIDREQRQLERRRKEVEAKIKRAAKENRIGEVKVFAKDIIRIKKAIEKFEMAKANLQAIEIQLMSVNGQQAIMDSMKKSVVAYKSISKIMDPQSMQKIMAEYTRESQRQEMMREITEGTMDEALDAMGDQEEEDALVNQVLQEIGVQIGAQMGNAPNVNIAQATTTDQLNERLNKL